MAEKKIREMKQTARRVFLDPSSPSVSSIIRVIVITLLFLSVWDFVKGVIGSLTSLFFLVILAIFFAYLIDPLVKFIRKPFKERHLEKIMPRPLAIVIAYLIVFTAVGLAISYLAPRLVEQAKEFAGNLPSYSEQAQNRLQELNEKYGNVQIPDDVKTDLNKKIGEIVPEIGTKITTVVGSLAISLLSISPWFFLVPILAFFFLKDVNAMRLTVLRMFPSGRWRARAESFLEDVNTTLAAYTRAQLISCFLIGTICTIGFYFLGVNYALLLGILAGVLEFIPLIGPLILAVTAITVSAFYSPWQALYVAIFLIILRIVQDYVLYPRIVREGIHLHPLAIILSVLAGEQIAGIPGVFLSIPIVALLTVLIKHIREHRKSKGLVADLLKEDKDEGETLAT
jgi:predicted PurR-regulated permease PerM